ncbi:MAG: glycosyltransferase family 2 protein [bacterium]
MRELSLSIVVPAYNEEGRIGPSLERIASFLDGRDYVYEIVVVDDGSRDGTVGVVEEFAKRVACVKLLRNDENRGKGYTVRRGVLEAKGRLILFTDADLAVPIEELPRLISACEEGADIAIGDRYLEESNIRTDQPLYRRIIGHMGGLYVRTVILRSPPDTQCGFKCLRKEAAHRLFGLMRVNGGMFDVELIYLARKAGYKIKQIPVAWSHCQGSSINIVKCLLTDPFSLIAIRVNDLLGRYRFTGR